jgi:hypothetical protein
MKIICVTKIPLTRYSERVYSRIYVRQYILVLRVIVSCAHCVHKTTMDEASGSVFYRYGVRLRGAGDWGAQVLKKWEWSFFRSVGFCAEAATGSWDWNAIECGYLFCMILLFVCGRLCPRRSSLLPTTTMRTFHVWRGSTHRKMQNPTPREHYFSCWVTKPWRWLRWSWCYCWRCLAERRSPQCLYRLNICMAMQPGLTLWTTTSLFTKFSVICEWFRPSRIQINCWVFTWVYLSRFCLS